MAAINVSSECLAMVDSAGHPPLSVTVEALRAIADAAQMRSKLLNEELIPALLFGWEMDFTGADFRPLIGYYSNDQRSEIKNYIYNFGSVELAVIVSQNDLENIRGKTADLRDGKIVLR